MTKIKVNYKFAGNKHYFTSASEMGKGLFVAHPDLALALKEVEFQLKDVLAENHKTDVSELTSDTSLAELEQLSVTASPLHATATATLAWTASALQPA